MEDEEDEAMAKRIKHVIATRQHTFQDEVRKEWGRIGAENDMRSEEEINESAVVVQINNQIATARVDNKFSKEQQIETTVMHQA